MSKAGESQPRPPPGYDPRQYEHPSVATDVVIIKFEDSKLQVLLIERKHDPYAGWWALPGGFVEMRESVEAAAQREVWEETGLSGLSLVPLRTFSEPNRDPRTRVISVAFLALTPPGTKPPQAGDDARTAQWFPLRELPPLAFDHPEIIQAARERLRELALLTPRIFELLPPVFSNLEFLELCRQVMGKKFSDPDPFFLSLRRLPIFVPCGRGESGEEFFRIDLLQYHDGDFMFLLFGD